MLVNRRVIEETSLLEGDAVRGVVDEERGTETNDISGRDAAVGNEPVTDRGNFL